MYLKVAIISSGEIFWVFLL